MKHSMDLVTLLERVPPLLECCVCCHSARTVDAIRTLRLVDKEASRVALLGLEGYTLILQGGAKDSHMMGTRLLRKTSLKHLILQVAISDSYNPAHLLEIFVDKMGAALSSVSFLMFEFEEECSSCIVEDAMGKEIMQILGACTAIKALSYLADPSAAFLERLGLVCPNLCSLYLSCSDAQVSCMQATVNLLPSLLPRITNLDFHTPHAIIGSKIPDMSKNIGIDGLHLKCCISAEAEWLRLPPKLQYLKIQSASVAPPLWCDSGKVLESLRHMEFCGSDMRYLSQITHLLRGLAPSVQASLFRNCEKLAIECKLDEVTAADLSFMIDLVHIPWVRDACYFFDLESRLDSSQEGRYTSIIKALPCMAEFTRCSLMACKVDQLELVVKLFPDIVEFQLQCSDINDVALQYLHGFSDLEALEICALNSITSLGLMSLCPRLPALKRLKVESCDRITYAMMVTIDQLLTVFGQDLRIQTDLDV